jgi:hypothetical protein
MVLCADLKEGDILRCPECGLELTITKVCRDSGTPLSCDESGPCCNDAFKCCDKEMEKFE